MRKVSNEKTGRISGIVAKAAAGAMAALVAGTAFTAVPYNVLADEVMAEWREENGVKYWYENGVRQGVKYREDGSIDASYRGKEIYDPSSNAWYWLDCVQNGAVAKDKDVYQESQADDAGNIGKWVRYDADGHMVKGWSEKNGNKYYFDLVYGTMAKGDVDIDGVHYYFNKDTGILESGGQTDDDGRSFNEDGWHKVDGVNYWYENGVRQGVKYREDGSIDASYRGKEIYDPSSNAWYWLDCVQNGAVAKDKDVYQESQADDAGNIGKWVRYDADGHMVKGWSEKNGNRYYFDPVYGTMAKGLVCIGNDTYYFDMDMGVLNRNVSIEIDGKKYTCDADGKINENNDVKDDSYLQCKVKSYDSNGDLISETEYDSNGEKIAVTYFNDDSVASARYQFNKNDKTVEYTKDGEYWKYKTSLSSLDEFIEYSRCEFVMQADSTENWLCSYKYYRDGVLRTETIYDEYGNYVKSVNYNADGTVADVYEENQEYEYYENGTIKRLTIYSSRGDVDNVLEFNENGKLEKKYFSDYGGEPNLITEYVYDTSGHFVSSRFVRLADGFVSIETKVIFSEGGKFCGMSSIHHYDGVYFEMVYAYDDNMNLIKQKWNYYDDIDMGLMTDVSEGYEYVYDEYGNQINRKEIKDGQEVNYAWKYEYDYADNGKISQVKEYYIGDDGTAELLATKKNEFDAHGNCILSTYINNKTGKSYIAMKAEYVYE